MESVETDLNNDKVIVKGIIEPQMLVDYVKKKRTWKQASIVKDEEKKDEEKKEDPKDDSKDGNPEKKGEGEDGKEDEDKYKTDIKRSEYWGPKYYMDYAYPPQYFSDENPNACSVM